MKVTLIQIRDNRNKSPSATYNYPVHSKQAAEMHDTSGISLLPETTARTNVMLRDSKGRFVSFRNPSVLRVLHNAVRDLKPFPTI